MKFKETALTIIGWIFACFGVFILMVGLGMTIDGDLKHASDGPPIALCSLIFLFPAGVSLYMARRVRRESEHIITIAHLVKSYGRITLEVIAGKLEVGQAEALKILTKAISSGRVSGTFDRTTDEFVSGEAGRRPKGVTRCPHCGYSFTTVYLEHDTVKCEQCGSIIS